MEPIGLAPTTWQDHPQEAFLLSCYNENHKSLLKLLKLSHMSKRKHSLSSSVETPSLISDWRESERRHACWLDWAKNKWEQVDCLHMPRQELKPIKCKDARMSINLVHQIFISKSTLPSIAKPSCPAMSENGKLCHCGSHARVFSSHAIGNNLNKSNLKIKKKIRVKNQIEV